MNRRRFLRRHVALPSDHGSWVLFLSPLAIGIVAGWLEPSGSLRMTSLYLLVAAVSAFLLRQPLTLAVKIVAGRRSRDDLTAALAWSAVYSALAGVHVLGLVLRGFGYVLALAIPGSLVFGWYLILVGRREERRQIGLEVLAAGALALAAPAGLWVGLGRTDPRGWLLWLMLWAQSAASLLHVYEQLTGPRVGAAPAAPVVGSAPAARGALLLATGNVAAVLLLAVVGRLPPTLMAPFLLQLGETAWRGRRSARGLRPSAIGLRQLWVSTGFTVLFLVAWVMASR